MRAEIFVCLNPAVYLLSGSVLGSLLFLVFFFLLLHWTACGILVPQRGIQPTPFTVRAQSLTTGPPEFPKGLCYP